jgi:hypothetical protein
VALALAVAVAPALAVGGPPPVSALRYAIDGCVFAVENTLRLVASLVMGRQYSQSFASP